MTSLLGSGCMGDVEERRWGRWGQKKRQGAGVTLQVSPKPSCLGRCAGAFKDKSSQEMQMKQQDSGRLQSKDLDLANSSQVVLNSSKHWCQAGASYRVFV